VRICNSNGGANNLPSYLKNIGSMNTIYKPQQPRIWLGPLLVWWVQLPAQMLCQVLHNTPMHTLSLCILNETWTNCIHKLCWPSNDILCSHLPNYTLHYTILTLTLNFNVVISKPNYSDTFAPQHIWPKFQKIHQRIQWDIAETNKLSSTMVTLTYLHML